MQVRLLISIGMVCSLQHDQVNGMDLRLATHQEAVQWLVQQRGDIELFVRHVPPPPGLKVRCCVTCECLK